MNNKKLVFLIHAAIWTVVFISPLMFLNHGNGVSLNEYMRMSVGQLWLFIIFYINYIWLVPKLFDGKNRKYYLILNIIIIICVGIGLHFWMHLTHTVVKRPPHIVDDKEPEKIMEVFLVMRNIFNLAISAAIATTVQLSMRWQSSENARREAETARINAELKNLRAQINPHFLLNTLNNIYALTSFDTEKAQEAIQELSKMLRYMLYDNQLQFVNLEKEVTFLTNYINLMKIRLSDEVDVKLKIKIPTPCNIQIAPLIFISLKIGRAHV